jgi:hypothetical protein
MIKMNSLKFEKNIDGSIAIMLNGEMRYRFLPEEETVRVMKTTLGSLGIIIILKAHRSLDERKTSIIWLD